MNNRIEEVKNGKIFKKGDLFIGVALLLIVIASVIMMTMPKGGRAEIYLNGNKIQTLSLSSDAVYVIDRDGVYMTVVVKNGGVQVSQSNCDNHLCEKTTAARQGDRIVCLPNKVIIVITGESEVDAST